MRKMLLYGLVLIFSGTTFGQWNPDPTENNPIVLVGDKGIGAVTGPVSASDGAGGMFIAWVDNRNSLLTGNDIFITRILANGNVAPGFTAGGTPVCLAVGNQTSVSICEDGQGGVVVAWTDPRTTGTTNNDVYAQRIDGAGNAIWTSNGVPVANTPVNENQPALVLTSANELAIVWRFTGATSGVDLAFNYFQLANGAKKLENDVLIIEEPNAQNNQQIVPDGSGGFITCWSDGRITAGTAGVVAQRYNSAGVALWAASGAIVRTPGGTNITSPVMVADEQGGAVFAWSDSRAGTTNSDIYVQRLDGTGSPLWTANGVQATSASGQQLNPAIIRSGDNYIVGWNDQQAGGVNFSDVYAQAFSGLGSPLWNGGNPLPVVTEADQQPLSGNAPVIIGDGLGGAIFIWDDRRNSSTNIDVFAQRVTSAGAKQWAEGGVAIATREGSNQRDPMAVEGLNNSVMIAWRDSRSTNANSEIYASQLLRDGTLPVTLLEVGATQQGKNVNVQWTTTGEYNLSHFEVERSIDGRAFQISAKVKARNIPGVHQYTSLDGAPVAGDNFYRIKSMNLDGTFKYSEMVKVRIVYESNETVHMYPNPVVAGWNLQLNDLPFGNYHVRIVDMAGRNIESYKLQKAAVNQTFVMNAQRLGQGIYKVQIINESGEIISVQSLIKR
jgi:hypothetical protein